MIQYFYCFILYFFQRFIA